jgi:tetratricopeptide (TPR) repeat protein
MVLKNYASTLRQMGRLDEAADYGERAYAKALRNGDQEAVYSALYARALIYIERDDLTRAGAMLAELEPRLRRAVAPNDSWLAALASAQALLASAKGDSTTALLLADRAVDMVEAARQAGRSGIDFLAIALIRRSTVELDAARPSQAAADAQRALSQLKGIGASGAFSSLIGRAYLNLGRALQAQGKHDQAGEALNAAAENLQETVGPDHPDTRRARQLAALETQHK